ncbi:HET-s/LopB domain protein [Wilcoxina mikolae CBS 423.85]|nr:HET-s/LopB domain protein [Wilcoxina mikolae CBS 423.85]
MGPETVLSIVATADLCLKYGQIVVAKYEVYKDSETELGEAIIRVQHYWMMIEMKAKVLRDLSQLGLLEEKLQLHFNTLFQRLQVKLQEATVAIDSVIGSQEDPKFVSLDRVLSKKGDVNKMKFAMRVKKTLDKTLAGLKEWHDMLEKPWFLLALVRNPAVDRQLNDQNASQSGSVSTLMGLRNAIEYEKRDEKCVPIFMQESELLEGRIPVVYSSGELAKECQTGCTVFIDNLTPAPFENLGAVTKNVRNLARILSAVEPMKFGILVCRGVIKICNPSGTIERFQFVFSIPDSLHTPQSLRELLITGRPYPLGDCFQLAKQLARSVLFVHTASFVHKNIRPETIIVFQIEKDGSTLGVPFLVGFEKFRPEDGNTYLAGDSEWEKDLYRHPARQGLFPEELYRMQHDIYSLGVCLLEIGLWDSFVLRDNERECLTLTPTLDLSKCPPTTRPREKAYMLKGKLVEIAKQRLPNKMGSKYTEVVVSCLKCLDGGDNDFGHESEFLDEDGILVGVRYIEKVLLKLEEISV